MGVPSKSRHGLSRPGPCWTVLAMSVSSRGVAPDPGYEASASTGPEDAMFIWMWIKRRRAAKAAQAAASRPTTEDPRPGPPSATPR